MSNSTNDQSRTENLSQKPLAQRIWQSLTEQGEHWFDVEVRPDRGDRGHEAAEDELGENSGASPYAVVRTVGATLLFAAGGAIAYGSAEAAMGGSQFFGGRGFHEAYTVAVLGLMSCLYVYRSLHVRSISSAHSTEDPRARRAAITGALLWGFGGLWMPTVVLATAGQAWVPLFVVLAGGIATEVLASRVGRALAPIGSPSVPDGGPGVS